MQRSHCHWLNWGHSFLAQMCAWEAFSLLAVVTFRGYHPVPLNRRYCQLLWRGTSYSSAQNVRVAYTRVRRRQVVRVAPSVLCIIKV